MVLQKELFKSFLVTLEKPAEEENLLAEILEREDEQEREEAAYAYHVCKRIMRARTGEEISDISIADILLCFKWQKVFSAMFEGDKACDIICDFKKEFLKLRTARKVRVL